MMRALVERFGADYTQWRALVAASLKIDMRRANGPVQQNRSSKRNVFVSQFLFYFIIGMVMTGVTAIMTDLFLAATVIITYAVFMVGIMVLLDYHTVVTAPDDYNVLGFQPVSSRTYFAARSANLLIFVLAISSMIAGPTALTFVFRTGWQPAVGAALMLGVWGATITTAMAMVLLYGWLVQRVAAARLKKTLSYLQLITSFVVYGGYMFLPQYLTRHGIAKTHLAKTIPVMLLPTSWFASYVDIARYHLTAWELVPAAAAIALLVVVARASSGRISLQFAERLSQMTVTTSASVATLSSKNAPRLFREGEARAVYLLIRSQFRSDQRFRMAVLAILPITVLYLFMAVSRGGLADPFVFNKGLGNSSMLYVAVILFPLMLVMTMTRSDNYKASWVFYATPANRATVVQAMKDVVFMYFVLPYLAVMGGLFFIWIHNPLHVAIHLLLLGLISHLGLLLLMAVDPQLPFARPPVKGERSMRLFVVTLFAVVFAGAAIPLTSRFIYISATRTAAALVALLAMNAALGWIGRRRIGKLIVKTEFAG
jgi:hypothetical protein